MCYDVSDNLHNYIKSTVVESYTQYILKEKLSKMPEKTCQKVREEIIEHIVNVLYIYRKECAKNSSPTELVIPESIKLNSLYICSALKSHALRVMSNINGEFHLDHKIYWI